MHYIIYIYAREGIPRHCGRGDGGDGHYGADGANGANRANGANGRNGKDGKDGINGEEWDAKNLVGQRETSS